METNVGLIQPWSAVPELATHKCWSFQWCCRGVLRGLFCKTGQNTTYRLQAFSSPKPQWPLLPNIYQYLSTWDGLGRCYPTVRLLKVMRSSGCLFAAISLSIFLCQGGQEKLLKFEDDGDVVMGVSPACPICRRCSGAGRGVKPSWCRWGLGPGRPLGWAGPMKSLPRCLGNHLCINDARCKKKIHLKIRVCDINIHLEFCFYGFASRHYLSVAADSALQSEEGSPRYVIAGQN